MAKLKFSLEQLKELVDKMEKGNHAFVNFSPCNKYDKGEKVENSAYIQCFGTDTIKGSGGLYFHSIHPTILQNQEELFYHRPGIFVMQQDKVIPEPEN